jgi:hypothetical protein
VVGEEQTEAFPGGPHGTAHRNLCRLRAESEAVSLTEQLLTSINNVFASSRSCRFDDGRFEVFVDGKKFYIS